MYSNVVLKIESHLFEGLMDHHKLNKGVLLDTDLDENDWDGCTNKKAIVKKETKKNFPQNVKEQLLVQLVRYFYLGKVNELKLIEN